MRKPKTVYNDLYIVCPWCGCEYDGDDATHTEELFDPDADNDMILKCEKCRKKFKAHAYEEIEYSYCTHRIYPKKKKK